MLATQVLPEDSLDDATPDESEIIGHLVTDNDVYEITKGENKIGRDPNCSIVIENCTISKLHAVIESDGRDETFIYDCGSTNFTRLKKKKLRPHCRYKLDDRTDVVLGNVVATFKLAPEIIYPEVKIGKTIPVNTQALDELDDIFDLPTQITVPVPGTSRNVPRSPDDLKTQKPVLCDKKPALSNDSKSDSGLDNSEIFNLSTQCQLVTQDDCDKVKSLLNDGQDDVLYDFMSTLPPKCEYEPETDIFNAPTQILNAPTNMNSKKTQADESDLEISVVNVDQDSVDLGKFDEMTGKEVKIDAVPKEVKDADEAQGDGDDDEILTQEVLSDPEINESVVTLEDLIATQEFDDVDKGDRENKGFGKMSYKNDSSSSIRPYEKSQDLIDTQIFELVDISEQVESHLSNSSKVKKTERADNSGDETISDIELESQKSFTMEEGNLSSEIVIEESQKSNDSYTFEIAPKRPDAESDATDCEIEIPIKVEPEERAFEETQVLTLTPPCDLKENISTEKRSPSPRCWSPLSLEMPPTQDVESTMDEFLRRENQVGHESKETDSPLKRNSDDILSAGPSPAKKPKTDSGLSKLWQVHDIAQIQPTRTRSSLRTLDTNKQSCRRSTRGRKSNPEITPFLIRCRKKTETPKENKRASRSRQSERFRTPRKKNRGKTEFPVIAFTGFENESLKKIIHELGGEKTDDVLSASVVVANKVRRTVKFLCAIGLSLPIVSPQWLLSSKKEKKFINPRNFILKDTEAEKNWGFSLRNSLEKSKSGKLLEGYSVFATQSTKPPVKDLLAIVECCGGIPIVSRPTVWPKKTIIVSCEEDKEVWPPLRVRNIKLVHYEFILTGVLLQKIDFKSYSLR